MSESSVKHKPLVGKLVLLTAFMFAFGFMLVPLYDVFCEVTGINGKTSETAYSGELSDASNSNAVVDDRKIRVQFVAMNNADMPWDFAPNTNFIDASPGEAVTVSFNVKNMTQKSMIGQAVPSLSPSKATSYFHKTECFCFQQQPLSAGEQRDMALRFIIDPELPSKIKTITLSYTLFDATHLNKSENADNKTAINLSNMTMNSDS